MEVSVNGETLHYERAGAGIPLLLVHSLGTGAWMWREQIDHWSNRFDVIAFDARGHGASTHHGTVSVEAIASDIRAALGTLGIGSVHLIGISMGGPIGAHIRAADPASVRSFVIADSFVKQGEAGRKRAQDIAMTLASASMADYGVSYAKGTLHPSTPKKHFDELAASIAGMDKDAYIEIAQSVFTSDVAALMAAITQPVRVLVGAEDMRTPPALSQEIANLVPHADLQVIDDAAHLSNLDQPKAFQAAVDDFLARVG
jgi:3-oxoadipate enol-lactonase